MSSVDAIGAVVWTVLGAFDAVAAFIVETTAPWPEFFMLATFGRSMFFAATMMHLAILALLLRSEERTRFGLGAVTGPARGTAAVNRPAG